MFSPGSIQLVFLSSHTHFQVFSPYNFEKPIRKANKTRLRAPGQKYASSKPLFGIETLAEKYDRPSLEKRTRACGINGNAFQFAAQVSKHTSTLAARKRHADPTKRRSCCLKECSMKNLWKKTSAVATASIGLPERQKHDHEGGPARRSSVHVHASI